MAKKQTDGNLALEQQRVIVIPAHDEIVAQKLRVAAYARVSSSSEDQLNSYRVQNQYYSELISSNPDWEMVDIYADEGITGTSVEKREDFQRMMRDCRKGKIDRILVKSISRFARNTKDCLAAVRELKELGVSVQFEEQGIDTARVSSEMVTAIMASLAQKGSESISGNVQWGYQKRMESGMPDHHEAIVSREQYNAVKAEMARRSALRSPSKTAVTGRSCYTSKYALSDRLVCGECGTLYRRCTWTSCGRKYPVWRCTGRLNYGTKYCHDSPTIKEEPLQNAILAAINSVMSDKPALLDRIKNAVSLELLQVQGQTMSLADIEQRLAQLDEQFQRLLAEAIDAEDKESCNTQFAGILSEQTALKKQKEAILRSSTDTNCVCTRMKQAEQAIENAASTITEWNENAVRQIVERVTVLSADEILVRIKGGAEIKQTINK